MAMGNAHSLYHIGIIKYYKDIELNLHYTCNLIEANHFYRGAGFSLENVRFRNALNLYIATLVSLLKRESVIFIGIHLWQAIMLFPFMIINGNVLIHLHGQAHALKFKSVKYILWKMLSRFCKLVIANPAWAGVLFVEKIVNLNHINNGYQSSSKSVNVVYYSAVGKRPMDILEIKKRIEARGLLLVLIDKKLSYERLNELLSNSGFLYFECIDDYYLYSPSGRISDALNYGLKLVLRSEDNVGIRIAKKYEIEFTLI
jgi:hypothetical protein